MVSHVSVELEFHGVSLEMQPVDAGVSVQRIIASITLVTLVDVLCL